MRQLRRIILLATVGLVVVGQFGTPVHALNPVDVVKCDFWADEDLPEVCLSSIVFTMEPPTVLDFAPYCNPDLINCLRGELSTYPAGCWQDRGVVTCWVGFLWSAETSNWLRAGDLQATNPAYDYSCVWLAYGCDLPGQDYVPNLITNQGTTWTQPVVVTYGGPAVCTTGTLSLDAGNADDGRKQLDLSAEGCWEWMEFV